MTISCADPTPSITCWLYAARTRDIARCIELLESSSDAITSFHASFRAVAFLRSDKLADLYIAKCSREAALRCATRVENFIAAAHVGSLRLLRFLIDHNADIDGYITNSVTTMRHGVLLPVPYGTGVELACIPYKSILQRQTALWTVASHGNAKLARALLKNGAASFYPLPGQPLHAATRVRSRDVIRLLVRHGCPVDLRENGLTALEVAVQIGASDVCCLLLQLGANVNARHPDTGSSPLATAIQYKRSAILVILFAHGATSAVGPLRWHPTPGQLELLDIAGLTRKFGMQRQLKIARYHNVPWSFETHARQRRDIRLRLRACAIAACVAPATCPLAMLPDDMLQIVFAKLRTAIDVTTLAEEEATSKKRQRKAEADFREEIAEMKRIRSEQVQR